MAITASSASPVESSTNDVSPDEIARFYSVFGGHIFFQTLRTAAKLDLFTVLSQRGPLTRAEVASALGVKEHPARVLLLPLTVCGLLLKEGDRYRNSRIAEQLLVGDSPYSVLDCIDWQHSINYTAMSRMLESVVEGRNAGLDLFEGEEPTLYQRLAHDPEREAIFQRAMRQISLQSNPCLANGADFSGVSHVVDVGGGDGTNAIALATRWPHLRVTVFDSPTVCAIADDNIRDKGFAGSVRTQHGNCFKTPFPTDADCLLFSHFFTIWSPEQNVALLEKCHTSLPAGGRVVLFNQMQEDEEVGSWAAAVGSPYFLTIATGGGMLYTWSEYESWMQQAGFDSVERIRLPRDHGAVIGHRT